MVDDKQNDEDDFDWSPDNDDVAISEQRAIAVYVNAWGHVVIRQGEPSVMDGDAIIVVKPENVPLLVKRLQRMLEEIRAASE